MLPAIQAALKVDIKYKPPANYMAGAGDTYFSGKMLAKLARILLVAEEVGGADEADFNKALDTLRKGVEVWFDPKAGSPFLYDRAW
jgi:endoglucanase Acf2